MTRIILETSPVPLSRARRPAHHDYGPTEAELARLLAYIDHVAHYRTILDGHTPGTASFDEYTDRGCDALLAAWAHWDPWRGIPFYGYAQQCIWRRMRGATKQYQVWALPGGRDAPDAEAIGRVVAQDTARDGTGGTRERVCDPPDSLAWFRRDLGRHWSCMSPTMRQALADTCADRSREAIAARDGVTPKTVSERSGALVTFLRRHVVDRDTSCDEEQAHWKRRHGHAILDPAVKADQDLARARARVRRWRQNHRDYRLAYERAYRQHRKAPAALAAAD